MRFHFSYILAGVAMISALTGCIKDNNDIKSLVIQNPGIGFPYGANKKNDIIIRPSAIAQQVPGLLLVTLEDAAPASSDIHISIADNSTTLVNTYNAANGTAFQPLPGSLWSIPAELIIKSGDRYAMTDIKINKTTGLNLNLQYAIGISITGASGGNKIADNLKNLIIVFRIQVDWDGKFSMKGEFYNHSWEPAFTSHDFSVELRTISFNKVQLYWPLSANFSNGFNGFGYNTPYTIHGVPAWGLPIYGLILSGNAVIPNINPNDISVIHDTPPATDIIFFPLDSCNGKLYHNRWDSASRKLYIAFGNGLGYNPNTQTHYFVPGTGMAWIDTLTYLGPR
jgi:hypothetical protein